MCDLIDLPDYETVEDLKKDTFNYIEVLYNRKGSGKPGGTISNRNVRHLFDTSN